MKLGCEAGTKTQVLGLNSSSSLLSSQDRGKALFP